MENTAPSISCTYGRGRLGKKSFVQFNSNSDQPPTVKRHGASKYEPVHSCPEAADILGDWLEWVAILKGDINVEVI
jgi:hypothetical protein